MQLTTIITLALASLTSATLLVNYSGGPLSSLDMEMEGGELHCTIQSAGNACFIKAEEDSDNGRQSLHFKRDPHFRRAEIRTLTGQIETNKHYYIGYNFRLSAVGNGLVPFQFKRADKDAQPKQNIPLYFHIENGKLEIRYYQPGGDGETQTTIYTGGAISYGAGSQNHLGMHIYTGDKGTSSLELWIDGKKQTFVNGQQQYGGMTLVTGETYPKFGIYRGEQATEDKTYCPSNGVFTGPAAPAGSAGIYNSWVYMVMISDASMDEVKEAAGL